MGEAALKQGWQWNRGGQGLCCLSLLGSNKPWGDLIFKTCWTCWQEQSPISWFVCCYQLHFNCLVIVFVFLEFRFWCMVSVVAPDHGPAKAELLWAEVWWGCRHPMDPPLLPGGTWRRRSVLALKGPNVGNERKLQSLPTPAGRHSRC